MAGFLEAQSVRHASLVLLLVGAGFLIASCDAPVFGPLPTPTPTPSPVEIAAQAGEQMLAIDSLHFVIEISGQLVYLDVPPTLALKRAEGDVVRPDRMRAVVKVFSFGMVSEVGIIGLGDEQYITNPLNQQWERLPPSQGWYFDPALLFDPEYGIEAILGEAAWTFGAGGSADVEQDVEEQAHYILHGQLPGERLTRLTSGMIASGEVMVDIWVNRQDVRVDRIQIVELESNPENPTSWLIEFSAHDEAVNIQAPPIP